MCSKLALELGVGSNQIRSGERATHEGFSALLRYFDSTGWLAKGRVDEKPIPMLLRCRWSTPDYLIRLRIDSRASSPINVRLAWRWVGEGETGSEESPGWWSWVAYRVEVK